MRSLLKAAAVAMAVALVGCASPPEAEPQAAAYEATGQGSLTVTTEDDYRVAGTWVFGDALVQFDSQMSEEGVSTVKLTVNGADFDTTYDYFSGGWEADGHKNTLFRAEVDALKKLELRLNDEGKQVRPWQRLFAAVSRHAASPAGYTFLKRSGGPAQADEAQHRESNSVANDGVTYICKGASAKKLASSWDYVWAEHDSLDGEGGSPRNAAAGNTTHSKLQGYEPAGCRLGRASASGGYGAGSCEGRCGAGCPRGYNFYFTKDCLDHDICLDYHPAADTVSYSGDCGYEFSDADGDFLSGTSVGYSWSCYSVPSDCEDNGNAHGSGT